ncbi:MAG: translation initiation factor IF-2 N-terminal domain-containing protein, partial [Candidatus Marinimicrobia bacterium]|nr:translation initiation factor IF-2 N-terminal domain-containing protein [Candidatus Neomarinimicrobiota bacterium]
MPITKNKKRIKIFQLAKQLNISHKDIIVYLKSKKIKTSVNKPLDEDIIKIVLDKFGKDIKDYSNNIKIDKNFTTTLQDKQAVEEKKRLIEDAAREKAETAREIELKNAKKIEEEEILEKKRKKEK